MAVHRNTEWIFPVPRARITMNTPPQSIIRVTYHLNPGNQETPITLFIRALNVVRNATVTRWRPLGVDYSNGRVQVVIRSPENNFGSHFFSLPNAIEDFTHIFGLLVQSFSVIRFQAQPWVQYELTLQFTRIAPPVVRRILRSHHPTPRVTRSALKPTASVRKNFGVHNPNNNNQATLRGYADVKKRLFITRGLEDFYTKTDSVLLVPTTHAGLCFPMAFLKCQLRVWVKLDDGTWDIKETKPKKNCHEFESLIEDIIDCDYLAHNDRKTDFYHYDRELNKTVLKLFNPYKPKHVTGEYTEYYHEPGWATDQYNKAWECAAMDMHELVSESFDGDDLIDFTDEDQVCQCYAEYFNTNIHLYSLCGGAVRYKSFLASNYPIDLGRHIHILVEEEHCYAITHVRHFLAKMEGSCKLSRHNVCDRCAYVTSDNVNRTTMNTHFNDCIMNNPEMKPYCKHSNTKKTEPFKFRTKYECYTCGVTTQKIKNTCHLENHEVEKLYYWECEICKNELTSEECGDHQCFFAAPKMKDPILNENLWCYDTESFMEDCAERLSTERHVYLHNIMLVVIQNCYDETLKFIFHGLDEFCEFICQSELLEDAVIFAHNGSGYDHQFVLQYVERVGIPHSIVPHASSQHKLLSLKVSPPHLKPREFKDFMA